MIRVLFLFCMQFIFPFCYTAQTIYFLTGQLKVLSTTKHPPAKASEFDGLKVRPHGWKLYLGLKPSSAWLKSAESSTEVAILPLFQNCHLFLSFLAFRYIFYRFSIYFSYCSTKISSRPYMLSPIPFLQFQKLILYKMWQPPFQILRYLTWW